MKGNNRMHKNSFFKIPIVLMLIFTVLFILTGCFLLPTVQNQPFDDGETDTDTDVNDTENDESTDVTPDITDGLLISDRKNEYGFVIICDKTSSESIDRALDIRAAIMDKTSVSLDMKTYRDTSNHFEIIVMDTPRELSTTLKNSVIAGGAKNDFLWGFAFNGKQLAIYANSDYAWGKCLSEFTELFFTEGEMTVSNIDKLHISCVTRQEYDLELKRKNTHLDPIFTSHAVLQRDMPITIYGTGIGRVKIEFLGQWYEGITVDESFYVTLPATPAGGPYTLTVDIEGTVTVLEDILFGDVILLAGQSNAELPLDQTDYSPDDYVSNDRVRTYYVGQHFTDEFTYKNILDNRWSTLDSSEAAKWSAIAYHLGNRIEVEQDVPVGIICVVKGACVIQSFMSPDAQAKFEFTPDELSIEHPCNTTVDRYKCFNQQGMVYEKMFSKITPYTVSSVIWYQGESNIGSGESEVYDQLLEAMINEWRKDLNNESLPFFIVKIHDMSNNEGWLAVREAQERAVKNIPSCYLVDLDSLGVCTDIHPRNKEEVSELIYNVYSDKMYG